MEIIKYLISPLLALLLAPLMLGIVNKTKAFFAGREGAPLLQLYYDLFRLFNKDSVISGTTSQIFRVAPIIVFGSILAAVFLLPFTSACKSFAFTGDFVLLFYLLGLARFFMIIAALDTGSAFEGMGASREAFFAALAEPVIFIAILTLLRLNQSTSMITAFTSTADKSWIIIFMIAVPLFIVMLTENSRIPFDDPNTHLELTMIHEVMILDHSGVDLAIMEYASALKFWLFTLLFVKIISPFNATGTGVEMITTLGLIILSSIAVGVIESVMARSRLVKIPQLLFSAGVVAGIGFYLAISKFY